MYIVKLTISFIAVVSLYACVNTPVKSSRCDCMDYFNISRQKKDPLLEFQKAHKLNDLGGFINDILFDTVLFEQNGIQYNIDEFLDAFKLNIDKNKQFQNSPQIGFSTAGDTAQVLEVLKAGMEKHWLDLHPLRFAWSHKTIALNNENADYYTLYALNTNVSDKYNMENMDVRHARKSVNPNNGEIGVSITMNKKGANKWKNYTSRNIGNFIALISFNKVLSCPIINGPITGGETLISGDFNQKEAEELVLQLECAAHIQKVGKKKFEKEIKGCE